MATNHHKVHGARGNEPVRGTGGTRTLSLVGVESGRYLRGGGPDGMARLEGSPNYVGQGKFMDRRGKGRKVKRLWQLTNVAVFLFVVGCGIFVITNEMLVILRRL